MNKITRYTTSLPKYDLFDSWGHSLDTIDVNQTFWVFLQNPKGLSISRNNHLLIKDLQTCYNYGAGVLCFPETKTNWNQESQLFTLQQIFRGVWTSSVVQPSHTPDPFLSTYQPGGTAVCDNWVSRVVEKGADPFGLGRWSYITLRGKKDVTITIVTAYNATVSPGEITYYHQQLRILSRLHREQHITAPPDPRRQFILDLQSWLEYLTSENHKLIVSMDANQKYDPDKDYSSYPLQYEGGKLTIDPNHDGKLSTLVVSCNLCLPLAMQHTTWPFPASHISGRHQIDYMFVSKSLLPAVQRSGILSHHSLTRGDHRPYYLDFDSTILFSEPAYQIEPASIRKLHLQDPRVVKQYVSTLYNQLQAHDIFSRLETLQGEITNQTWSTQCVGKYEKIDQTITEAMLSAEKPLTRRITIKFQWSPPLKEAVQ
jgi:hypothetical protein